TGSCNVASWTGIAEFGLPARGKDQTASGAVARRRSGRGLGGPSSADRQAALGGVQSLLQLLQERCGPDALALKTGAQDGDAVLEIGGLGLQVFQLARRRAPRSGDEL